MKTSYKQLAEVLETAIRSLPQADAPVMRTQISEWTEDRPFSEVREADHACREFASSRLWPTMENPVLAQVHLRLECALELCRTMLREAPMDSTEDSLLEMLLVAYWHGKGPEWVRFRYGS